MKKLYLKITFSFFFLLTCFFTQNTKINYKNYIEKNINLTYLSVIYQGDIYSVFKIKKVSSVDSITVKDYEYVGGSIDIEYLGESLFSPISGVVTKKASDNDKYIIIQTEKYEYKISGLDSYNVALYQRVEVGDIIGKIKNDSNTFKCIVTNLSKKDYNEVCALVNDYEAA